MYQVKRKSSLASMLSHETPQYKNTKVNAIMLEYFEQENVYINDYNASQGKWKNT